MGNDTFAKISICCANIKKLELTDFHNPLTLMVLYKTTNKFAIATMGNKNAAIIYNKIPNISLFDELRN